MSEKSPAFQFYPKDFLSDEKQAAMTPAEAGIYIRLLCRCWLEGSLPNDQGKLARLVGVSAFQMRQMWPALAPCFQEGDGGRLVQRRLEKERKKQEVFRQRASLGGFAKAEHKQESSSQQAPAKPLPNPALLSSVSDLRSPSPKEIFIPRDGEWEQFKAKYPGSGRESGFMAQQRFLAAVDIVGFDVLMAGLERYRQSKKVRDGFVIGMEKWLEKQLWIQEPEPADSSADDVDAMRKNLEQIDAERAARGR